MVVKEQTIFCRSACLFPSCKDHRTAKIFPSFYFALAFSASINQKSLVLFLFLPFFCHFLSSDKAEMCKFSLESNDPRRGCNSSDNICGQISQSVRRFAKQGWKYISRAPNGRGDVDSKSKEDMSWAKKETDEKNLFSLFAFSCCHWSLVINLQWLRVTILEVLTVYNLHTIFFLV